MKNFIKRLSEHTMDLILLVLGVSTAVFVAIMIWLYLLTGSIPNTLVQCWFQYLIGTECGAMGLIKIAKSVKWKASAIESNKEEIEKEKKKLEKMQETEAGK